LLGQNKIEPNDYVSVYNSTAATSDLYVDESNSYSAISRIAWSINTPVYSGGVIDHYKLTINHLPKKFPSATPDESLSIIPGDSPIIGYACLGAGVDGAGLGTGRIVRYTHTFPRNKPSSCEDSINNATAEMEVANSVASCEFSISPNSPRIVIFKAVLQKSPIQVQVSTSAVTGKVWASSACVMNGCQVNVDSDSSYCVANCGSTASCTLRGCPKLGGFSNDPYCIASCGAGTCAANNCQSPGGFSNDQFCLSNCGNHSCQSKGCPVSGEKSNDQFCVANCGATPGCQMLACPMTSSDDSASCVLNGCSKLVPPELPACQ
jgi:hypothetical protein